MFVGVTRVRGAAFRVTPLWVGVLALVGVFALVVGVPALDVRPFTCGRLRVGEFERVEGVESLGLFTFLTERGSLDVDKALEVLVVGDFREGVLRDTGGTEGDFGMSLCDRVWPF